MTSVRLEPLSFCDSNCVCLQSQVNIQYTGICHNEGVAGDLENTSPLEEWLKIPTLLSCYSRYRYSKQLYVTKSTINSHLFTCQHLISEMII